MWKGQRVLMRVEETTYIFVFLFSFFLVSLLIEYRDRGANGAVASGQMGAS